MGDEEKERDLDEDGIKTYSAESAEGGAEMSRGDIEAKLTSNDSFGWVTSQDEKSRAVN